MTPSPSDDRPVATGTERSVGEVVLALLSGSALAPFVQAIATKAGEDVHKKIKGLLGRRRAEPKPDAPIILIDQRRLLVLEVPPSLSQNDAYGLADVRVPAVSPQDYLVVRYDEASGAWRAEPATTVPAEAITVDDEE